MNFKFNSFKKAILLSFGILMLFSLMSFPVYAQHELNQTEQTWIEEAKSELENAISNPDLSQQERIEMVQRSAKTLKEYGQPSAFPSGDIPLKNFMEENYNLSRKQFENSNDLRQLLSNKLLDQQLKIINTMQIDVTEQQIKFLLPGNQIIDLSKDVVTSVLDWDMVSGVNGGASGSAKSLADRFKQMAQSKELIKKLDELWNAQRVSMQKLFADLNRITPLQEMLRKRYQMAEAGTIVMKGYEGAVFASKQNNKPATSNNSAEATTPKPAVSGEDDEFKETKYYFRFVKAETVKKVNKEMYIESLAAGESSMSASVKPPKPKEPFSVSASWNSPPLEFYPGETIRMTAKGSGDVRLNIEAFSSQSQYAQGVRTSENGSSVVQFEWKVNGYGSLYIKVNALVTAYTYAWASTTFEYEMVIVE